MRIAIIGTGAMGSLFAALLSAVADVVMIGSWAEQLRVVRERGLNLDRFDGGKSRHWITATSKAEEAWPSHFALILVKGWQTAGAARLAQNALAPNGLAITLQNGLGNLETLGKHVGSDRAVQGVTSEGATLLGPGMVRHAGHGQTYFATSAATRDPLEGLAGLFRQAGLETSLVDDAQSLIWGKLAVNAGINPLTALLQIPNGHLLKTELTLDIMIRAAREVAALAGKLGIKLPFDDAAEQAIAVARATAENRSSMAQDIARGMPTEIEQIAGVVVQFGQSLDVPTPMNEALLALVRAQVQQGSWHDAIKVLPVELRPTFSELSTLETE